MITGLLLLAGLFAAPLFARDAGDLDILLETPQVSGPQAARFVLASAGLLDPGLSGQEAEAAAWKTALEQGWAASPGGGPFRLKEAAYLVTAAFGIKGGLMYSLFPGPRYAYRELLHLKLIQGRADENSTLSGERLLRILGRVLQYTGEDRRLEAELLTAAGREASAGEEIPAAEGKAEVPVGEGFSSGSEGIAPYEGGFILE
jgi:hypothetical protein